MEQIKRNGTIKNLLYIVGGLGGISLIIIIHEMGHFLFAHFFSVPTPTFSLGFGPTIYAFTIGKTLFQLALLPFGGYVELDPDALAQLPYIQKMLIISAGILFNIIFAYSILFYYAMRNGRAQLRTTAQEMRTAVATMIQSHNPHNSLIGPIGIITIIGQSLAVNPQLYWFILAIISLNMGIFNIIPLPFFDGGKALIFTIEAVIGKTVNPTALWFISTIILALFVLLIAKITMNDIQRLLGKK